ncbi:MAG: hypothetical protein JXA03_15800 [Bacteroidales bacterium]|nr:hypothetical protein [Bacteroidales bacterium]
MILPHPESDLKLNIMVLGADIIEQLKRQDFVLVENLLEKFIKSGAKRTPDMFFNALTFLFSCGVLEKNDYKVRLVVKSIKQMSLFE